MLTILVIKFDDVTIQNLNLKNSRIELHKREVKFNYTLSNCYTGADLMFLFKEGLFFIIMRLFLNSNKYLLLSLVSTLKFSKDGEWLQSNK